MTTPSQRRRSHPLAPPSPQRGSPVGLLARPERGGRARARSISASLPSVGPPQVSVDPGTLRPADIQSGPPASEFLRKALVDAESFRGLKLYAKASQCLRQALAAAPESLELRAALQQVLLEAGNRPAAVEQMLAVSRACTSSAARCTAAEPGAVPVLELQPRSAGRGAATGTGRGAVARLTVAPPWIASSPAAARRPAGSASRRALVSTQSEQHEAFELRTRLVSGTASG